MNKRILSTMALASVVALGVACDKKKDEPATTQTTSATPAAPAPLSDHDKEFLTKAAQGGMLEVAEGQAIAAKAPNTAVKTFGQEMVTDHSKANDELKALAASKGATLPTQLDSDHQKKLDKLTKKNGPKLDKYYASDMGDDHEEDVKEFKDAAKNLDDPDLRAWADKTLPTLEHHLMMARDLKAQTKNEK